MGLLPHQTRVNDMLAEHALTSFGVRGGIHDRQLSRPTLVKYSKRSGLLTTVPSSKSSTRVGLHKNLWRHLDYRRGTCSADLLLSNCHIVCAGVNINDLCSYLVERSCTRPANWRMVWGSNPREPLDPYRFSKPTSSPLE